MKLQDYSSSDLSFPAPSPHNSSSSRPPDNSGSSSGSNSGSGEVRSDSSSRTRAGHSISNNSSSRDGDGLEEQQPMFDPKVIDMNASTILRYVLNRSAKFSWHLVHNSTSNKINDN